MALNGNFVSFQSIIERVYRNAGYQTIDWIEAIEHIADVIGLIGAREAYQTITTNSLNGNPAPLTIVDYRASLPSGYVSLVAARKIQVNDDGTISRFYPMIYNSDLFFQSPIKKIHEDISPGTYNTTEWTGEDGEYTPTPIIVEGSAVSTSREYVYSYRINNTLMETNFEDGFVELVYNGFVTDDHGYPMIPDDIKYIKAVEAYLIERIDYKKWRCGDLPDKVYRHSEQERDWYIAAARNKVAMPSIDRMESLKNQWLRSIPRHNEHATGFRYTNVQERRYIR